MTLSAIINSLSHDKQVALAIWLMRDAIPVWDKYTVKHKLTYRDSVVGLKHCVDKDLIRQSIDAVNLYFCSAQTAKESILNAQLIPLYKQFDDPIIALQDGDWELPTEVERTFFAAYNLLCAALDKENVGSDESYLSLSINQAIDALDSSETLSVAEIESIIAKCQH